MASGDPQRHALYDAKGRKVLLVLASVEQWLGKMEEITADKDQKDLFDDTANYNPQRDQPGYRRDQDRVLPGLSWEELKASLNKRADAQKEIPKDAPPPTLAELGLEGVTIVWPTDQREPIAAYPNFRLEPGETTVQALERAFPGCTFERPEPTEEKPALVPADPLDVKGADITGPFAGDFQARFKTRPDGEEFEWLTIGTEMLTVDDDETIGEALAKLYPDHEFRFVPNDFMHTVKGIPLDEIGLAGATLVYPDGTEKPLAGFVLHEGQSIEDALRELCQKEGATLQVLAAPPATGEDGQPLIYGSAALPAGADPDASDLLERFFSIGMTINLEAVKQLMPEQRAHARRWLGDWLDAFDSGIALELLPARPHFLPLFTPPARTEKPEKTPEPPAGKPRKPRKPH